MPDHVIGTTKDPRNIVAFREFARADDPSVAANIGSVRQNTGIGPRNKVWTVFFVGPKALADLLTMQFNAFAAGAEYGSKLAAEKLLTDPFDAHKEPLFPPFNIPSPPAPSPHAWRDHSYLDESMMGD